MLQTIIKNIIDRLFAGEYKRLRQLETKLVRENASLGGSKEGFYYRGSLHQDEAIIYKGKAGNLMQGLYDKAFILYQDKESVKNEKERVSQALALLLRDCHSNQDMRDALPNCMSTILKEIEKLPRTREEAYTLISNKRAYNQYMKLKPLLEFYVSSRLLY